MRFGRARSDPFSRRRFGPGPHLVQAGQQVTQRRRLAGQGLQPPGFRPALGQCAVLERGFLAEQRGQTLSFEFQPGGDAGQLNLLFRRLAAGPGQAFQIFAQPDGMALDFRHRSAEQDGAAYGVGGRHGLHDQGFRGIARDPLQSDENAGQLPPLCRQPGHFGLFPGLQVDQRPGQTGGPAFLRLNDGRGGDHVAAQAGQILFDLVGFFLQLPGFLATFAKRALHFFKTLGGFFGRRQNRRRRQDSHQRRGH